MCRLLHLLYDHSQAKEMAPSPTNSAITPSAGIFSNRVVPPQSPTQNSPLVFNLLTTLLASNPRQHDLLM